MSGLDIPLWKQELLKRKQAKLSHEKLISTQKSNESSSKTRVSNAIKSNSSALNHHLTDSEKGKTNVSDKNNRDIVHNSKKGSSYNRQIILPGSVDTRESPQSSGNVKSMISSVDTGPSRLERFEDKPSRNIGIHNKNYGASGSYSMHGMPQHTRVHHKNDEKSNKITDNNKTDRLSNPAVGQGVEREHISPRDVKKMWQLQATKDETLPKSHVTKNPALTKRDPHPSNNEIPTQINTQVGSNPTSVPKAYKSPYAKGHWRRPASVSDEKSVKTNTTSQAVQRNDVKSHTVKLPLSNGTANDNEHETGGDGVEHIQSVKSLLGLFGGRARPNINRKVSDNVLVSNKSGKDYRTSEIKTSSSKKPGLFKHHSEPNLFFPADNEVVRDMPTSPKKSPTAEVVVEDAALPSHQVSQGIKERMTRLRRASHSNMEDMEGFVEYQNGLNSDSETIHVTKNNESQQNQLNRKQSPQEKDIPEKISVSRTENNKQSTIPKQSNVLENGSRLDSNKHNVVRTPVDNQNREGPFIGNSVTNSTQKQNTRKKDSIHDNYSRLDNSKQDAVKTSVGKQNRQDLYNNVKKTAVQSDNEKPRLSCSVNSNNRLTSPVNHAPNSIGNHDNTAQNSITEIKNELHDQNSSEQLSDKLLPVFESGSPKKPATGIDLTDTNEHKSKHKYQSKQNNYAVEIDQSGSGLHNDVVSTKCLTEIKQIKQEAQPVIKNKETVEEKSNTKPRRKGLNVVDPLAVLQLTKDPILLKEKPAEAELGIFKQSPTGKVEIIKHEPDKKNQIAQINRAWDLDNSKPILKQNNVGHKNMPASTVQGSPMTPHSVPVTSIDEIPVSVIDDFTSNKLNAAVQPKPNVHSDGVKIGNTTFYDGTLSLVNGNVETAPPESGEEFIPVSSIDSEADLGPPPEIIFDKMPKNLKSSFTQNGKVFIFVIF